MKKKVILIIILGYTIIALGTGLSIEDNGSKTCLFYKNSNNGYLPFACIEFPIIRQTGWSFYEK